MLQETGQRVRRVVSGLGLCALAACVGADAATGPLPPADQPLALSLEEFARQAAEDGDAERAAQFSYAALSIRNGVTPVRLELRNAGQVQVFDALVVELEWNIAQGASGSPPPPPYKGLIAWRTLDGGRIALLNVMGYVDSAGVVNPLEGATTASTVLANARVVFREAPLVRPAGAASGVVWMGTEGSVRLVRSSAGAVCPSFAERVNQRGVGCHTASFRAEFSVRLAPMELRPFSISTSVGSREIATPREQTAAGALLTLTCTVVNALTGCP